MKQKLVFPHPALIDFPCKNFILLFYLQIWRGPMLQNILVAFTDAFVMTTFSWMLWHLLQIFQISLMIILHKSLSSQFSVTSLIHFWKFFATYLPKKVSKIRWPSWSHFSKIWSGDFLANFCQHLDNFYSNLWSHCISRTPFSLTPLSLNCSCWDISLLLFRNGFNLLHWLLFYNLPLQK